MVRHGKIVAFAGFLHLGIRLGVVAVCLLLLGAALHRMESKRVVFRPGLYGVLGRMGSGKSYFMALAVSRAERRHRPVISNFPVGHATVVSTWRGVLDAPERALVLIDEAQIWWPSNAWKAPTEVVEWITQIRKKKQTVLFATQRWGSVSRWLRDLSFGVWECEVFRSGHRYRLYPPHVAGSHARNRKSELSAVVTRKARVMALYDTYALVGSSVEWGGSDEGYVVSELEGRPVETGR